MQSGKYAARKMLTLSISTPHSGIIIQLGYNSGHIVNPFYPLFYPHRLDLYTPFIQCGQELIFKTFWSHSESNISKRLVIRGVITKRVGDSEIFVKIEKILYKRENWLIII